MDANCIYYFGPNCHVHRFIWISTTSDAEDWCVFDPLKVILLTIQSNRIAGISTGDFTESTMNFRGRIAGICTGNYRSKIVNIASRITGISTGDFTG